MEKSTITEQTKIDLNTRVLYREPNILFENGKILIYFTECQNNSLHENELRLKGVGNTITPVQDNL